MVLLIQLVNGHVVKLQQAMIDKNGSAADCATPFEAALLQKLAAARHSSFTTT